jgi:hypothetical protein
MAPPQQGYPQQQMAPQAYPAQPPQQQEQPWQNQGWNQLPPAMAQALQQEMESGGGEGGDSLDIDWYKPKQPSHVGQSAESTIRILPWRQDEKFWHKHNRHFCMLDVGNGKRLRLPRVCPRLNVQPGQPPQPCPICERKERAEAAGDKEMAKALAARERYFVNVLDAENQDKHFTQSKATGQTVCRSMVWGIGKGVLRKLGNIVGARGQIWDRQIGRYVKVYATKTGPEGRDVRYDAIDCSESCPLPPGFENIEVVPLESLDQQRSYQEMAKEISTTYPDVAGMPMQAPQQAMPAQAAPYANPYQQRPQQPPQSPAQGYPQAQPAYQPPPNYQAPPQQLPVTIFQPAQQWQPPPQQQAPVYQPPAPPPQQPMQGYPPPQQAPAVYQPQPAYQQPPQQLPPAASAPTQYYPPGQQPPHPGGPIPF